MGIANKLIQWGWVDSQGRSLPWYHWQQKPHRVPVAYLRDEKGKATPIYGVLAGFFKVQRGKAA